MTDFMKRQQALNTLLINKFGDRHGNKADAAAALTTSYPNFVNMCNGRLKVSDRILDAMNKLPEHTVSTISYVEPNAQGWSIHLDLTFDQFAIIEQAAESMNGGKSVTLANKINMRRFILALATEYNNANPLS